MSIFVIYKVFLLPYFNVFIIIFLQFFKFFHVPGCSGMFRNVPCSGFYRRPRGKGGGGKKQKEVGKKGEGRQVMFTWLESLIQML